MAAAWIVGAIMGVWFNLPWWLWYTILLLGTPWWALSICHGGPAMQRCLFIVVVLLSSGRSAAASQVQPPEHILQFLGSQRSGPVEVRISVSAEAGYALLCHVESVRHAGLWTPSTGSALLVGSPQWVEPGQVVQCLARIRVDKRFGRHRARLFIVDPLHISLIEPASDFAQVSEAVKKSARRVLVSEPVSSIETQSLSLAIVLGDRNAQWDHIADPFRNTGTAHLLAVSGLHLSVICGVVIMLARVMGASPQGASVLTVVGVLLMVVLVTVRTPILRSAVMVIGGSIMLGSRWRISAATTFSIAVVVILYTEPLAIIRPGFQLSFVVVAALIWILPQWAKRTDSHEDHLALWKTAIRAATVSWCVATPLSIMHFGVYSLIGIPATLLLTPVMVVILLLGYVRLVCSFIDPLFQICGHLLEFVSNILWVMVNEIAELPGSGIHIDGLPWITVLAVEAVSVVFFMTQSKRTWIWSGTIMILWWTIVLLISIH